MKITIASSDGKATTLDNDRRPPPEILAAAQALIARGSSQAEFYATLLLGFDACVTYERKQSPKTPDDAIADLGITFETEERPDGEG